MLHPDSLGLAHLPVLVIQLCTTCLIPPGLLSSSNGDRNTIYVTECWWSFSESLHENFRQKDAVRVRSCGCCVAVCQSCQAPYFSAGRSKSFVSGSQLAGDHQQQNPRPSFNPRILLIKDIVPISDYVNIQGIWVVWLTRIWFWEQNNAYSREQSIL